MKRLLYILLLPLVFSFSGCSKSSHHYEIRVSQNFFEITAAGGEEELTFFYANDWVIENRQQDWCIVSPMKGTGDGTPASQVLTITVAANPTEHTRNNIIVIRSGKDSIPFLVTQQAITAD